MTRKVNAVPKGYRTATPQFVVQNAAAAIEFYVHAFGAELKSTKYAADGITILRAELKIGNSLLHFCDEMPAYGLFSPITLGGTATATMLYLPGLDAAWDAAVEAGSTVLLPLEDAYWGERTGKLVDPFGHVWLMNKKIESVTKAEIEKRERELFAAPTVGLAEETPEVIDISEALANQKAKAVIAA